MTFDNKSGKLHVADLISFDKSSTEEDFLKENRDKDICSSVMNGDYHSYFLRNIVDGEKVLSFILYFFKSKLTMVSIEPKTFNFREEMVDNIDVEGQIYKSLCIKTFGGLDVKFPDGRVTCGFDGKGYQWSIVIAYNT
jgi:hypothetical protein